VWRRLQHFYQNPFTSLDPTWKVEQLVREPLDRFHIGTRRERSERVREALASVGLGEHLLSRKPVALSGGQRQRVAVTRALVLKPDVIALNEPISARRQGPGRHRPGAGVATGEPGADLCVRVP
jgi:peptide/nickel transport system ATP-binding protein